MLNDHDFADPGSSAEWARPAATAARSGPGRSRFFAAAALGWLLASQGCASVHPAPVKPKPPREQICRDLYDLSRNEPESARFFGNIAPGVGSPADDWREFRSEEEREAVRKDDNLNEVADVWTLAGGGALVRMFFTSPSGDWMLYVDYCYRPDATLAMIDSELRTFAGNMVVTRTQAYGPAGQRSAESVEYSDLITEQPTDEHGPEGLGFQDREVPPYTSERELPFWSLLSRGSKTRSDRGSWRGVSEKPLQRSRWEGEPFGAAS